MKKETWVLSDTPHKLYTGGKGYVQVNPKNVNGMHRQQEFIDAGLGIDSKLKKGKK